MNKPDYSKCYANVLGNCSGKISKEHIVSKAVLADREINLSGFSWSPDKVMKVTEASFVVRCLCERHNHLLSPYDNEALQFDKALQFWMRTSAKFAKYGFSLNQIPIIYPINGQLLEKWLIKTTINHILANNWKLKIDFEAIVPILFGEGNFKRPFGMNLLLTMNHAIDSRVTGITSVTPLINHSTSENELAGAVFFFFGWRFVVFLPCSMPPIVNYTPGNKGIVSSGDVMVWHMTSLVEKMARLINGRLSRMKHEIQIIRFDWPEGYRHLDQM